MITKLLQKLFRTNEPAKICDYSQRDFIRDIINLIGLVNASGISNANEALQDILAALRGPDTVLAAPTTNAMLKWLTTARIRAIVCPKYHGEVNFTVLTVEQCIRRDWLLATGSGHFNGHYYGACLAIESIFGYNLFNETKLNHKDLAKRRSCSPIQI
jgi:hypothetical protein